MTESREPRFTSPPIAELGLNEQKILRTPGDSAIIRVEAVAQVLTPWMNLAGRLWVGDPDSGEEFPRVRVDVVKVTDVNDPTYARLVGAYRWGRGLGTEVSRRAPLDVMLVAFSKDSEVSGYGFLASPMIETVGREREGVFHWVNPNDPSVPVYPFDDNGQISRKHLRVHLGNHQSIRFTQLGDNASTTVEAPYVQ